MGLGSVGDEGSSCYPLREDSDYLSSTSIIVLSSFKVPAVVTFLLFYIVLDLPSYGLFRGELEPLMCTASDTPL